MISASVIFAILEWRSRQRRVRGRISAAQSLSVDIAEAVRRADCEAIPPYGSLQEIRRSELAFSAIGIVSRCGGLRFAD